VTVTPLTVVSADSFGGSDTLLKQIRVTFDRAINPATFNAAAITIIGPGGRAIPVSWTAAVANSNGRTFDIGFASQTQAGTYTLRLSNAIRDTAGVALNAFTRNYTLSAPVTVAPLNVVSADSFGGSNSLLKQIRVTFDRAINPATFNAAAITITGPGGRAIPVSWTAAVANSNGRTFDIGFASQTQAGTYTLRLSNAIRDTAGVALNAFTRNYTLTQGTPTLATVNYSNNTSATVTPQGRAVSLINVPNNMTITDVNVTVNITHPRTSDLYIHLQAPDGTNIVLFNRKGGNSANLVRTTFDDQASNYIGYAQGPFTGSYIPDVLLGALNGKNASGGWKLWVVDRAGVNVGTLNSWSIQITGRVA
jgi:subtilisin-like proprotein convertase family protein